MPEIQQHFRSGKIENSLFDNTQASLFVLDMTLHTLDRLCSSMEWH